MSSIIHTRVIRIGNSQGIRLPKAVLAQVGLVGDVRVEIEADRLVVRPAQSQRLGWDEQFQQMAAHGDDALSESESLLSTEWESAEWQW